MTFSLRLLLIFPLVTVVLSARADDPAVLRQATGHWLDERDNWAFTQLVREYRGDRLSRERLERYDPSRPDAARWELLRFNGRDPTQREKADLTERKNRKRRRHVAPVADYFDFDRAALVAEDARTVRYSLPLRSSNTWVFPVDKVTLLLTIDKPSGAISQVQASIDEPFRVALGLARILDIDIDLDVSNELTSDGEQAADSTDPAAATPGGTARAVVTKFGERLEYEWSDFQRVTPHPSNAVAQK